jgi:hypothetical protein
VCPCQPPESRKKRGEEEVELGFPLEIEDGERRE